MTRPAAAGGPGADCGLALAGGPAAAGGSPADGGSAPAGGPGGNGGATGGGVPAAPDVPLPGGGTMVQVSRGEGPVVLGMPHTGTHLPEGVWGALNGTGRALADTDWRVERLYEGLAPGATVVRMCVHRYAIDANRDPSGASLYPGAATTDLVPLTDFDGRPIWDAPPTPGEVEARRAAFHAPYHAALAAELGRVRAAHGVAILHDCHSIRSEIPRLFEGRLPDLNLGTNGGVACAPEVAQAAMAAIEGSGFSRVLDGRFRGGWTTRHHGRPEAGVHAVQMEIAQAAYLAAEAPPWTYDEARAERLRATLARVLGALADLAPRLAAQTGGPT